MAEQVITLKDFNLGGQADSDYQGNQNSLARIVGFDLHAEPGILKVSQALTKESGATVDGFVKVAVPCSDGKTYWFSADSGKIWERTSGGSWSLVATNAQGACLGAWEHNGFIYYATQQYLGRWRIGLAWSARDDDWQEFNDAAQDPDYKPMIDKNLILYIGDSNLVAQVDETLSSPSGTISGSGTTITGVGTTFLTDVNLHDRIKFTDSDGKVYERLVVNIASDLSLTVDTAFSPQPSAASFQVTTDTFTSDALDLPKGYRVKSLGEHLDELLIGTYVSDNVNKTKIFRWDTWSVSFNSDDSIPEAGINAFIPEDNFALVSGGRKGNMYYYDGRQLQPFKRIRGDWQNTNAATIHPYAVANYNGIPLFGLSNVSGNPTLQGVYSLGAYAANYPKVLSLPYIISTGETESIEIGAVLVAGNDILVSWKSGSNYGVDKVDWSNKFNGAYFEVRVIMPSRGEHKTFDIKVGYKSMPVGTGITVEQKVNNGSWESVDTRTDSDRDIVYSTTHIAKANTVQFKITTSASANLAPEIDSVEISMQ